MGEKGVRVRNERELGWLGVKVGYGFLFRVKSFGELLDSLRG